LTTIGASTPRGLTVGAASAHFEMGTLPLSLVAHLEGIHVPGPVLRQLGNALRCAREAVRWIGGMKENLPFPWPPDMTPPDEVSP